MKKNFPSWLSQSVLMKNENIESINGSDYDIFMWLIYYTHKHYSNTNETETTFTYKDIRDSFEKKMNTDSIKQSLEKLNGMVVITNYLQSYDDKELIGYTPFNITILIDVNGGVKIGS